MTWVMVAVDLQWTTMGLLSVPHCILYTSSTTVMMVCGLEHLPWEVQFCIWNWVTKWVLPNYKCKQKSSWTGHMRNCLQDLVCTWSTIDTSLLTKPSYSLDTISSIESSPQGIVNPSLGQYWQHTSYCENRQLRIIFPHVWLCFFQQTCWSSWREHNITITLQSTSTISCQNCPILLSMGLWVTMNVFLCL